MGIFDTILGRTKPVRANLDALFSLPTAALTLQSAGGLVSSGHAGVCWKPPPGQVVADAEKEISELVGQEFAHTTDSFDYGWLLLDDTDLEELVTKIHMANSTLQDNGWGPQLLCSVFGLAALPGSAGLVAADRDADASSDTSEASGASDASGDLGETGDSGDSGEMSTRTVGPGNLLDSTAYLVYLFKRGTFYPFAPVDASKERRDTELELRIRTMVGADLPVESDLSRWFPMWDMPVS